LKNVLPSAVVVATVVLSGCNTDPTPRGAVSDAAFGAPNGGSFVAGERGKGGGDGVRGDLREVEVEIPVAEINLNGKGKVRVLVPTTDEFDAAEIDLETVTLGNGSGADTRVLRKKNGALMAKLEDDDGDGDLDLVLHFAVQELVGNGDLTESSTELVFEAATYRGPAVRGSAAVAPMSLEPKTILPSSRIDTRLRIARFPAVPAVWPEV
jgi:hypothetical protein